MCTLIETSFVLANLFAVRNKPVGIKQLKEIRREVERTVTSVFVDVSTASVCLTVQLYPEMFQWIGKEVARVDGSDVWFENEYIEKCINSKVPPDICDEVINVIRGYDEQ